MIENHIKSNTTTVGIIGAGPAGLSAAYCLVMKGYKVEIFEAGPQIGGMCRTINLWGQKVDLGPHRFFSKSVQVNQLWKEIAKEDYIDVQRLTRVFYDQKFFQYPIQVTEIPRKLGMWETVRCLWDYFKQYFTPANSDQRSFESWVTKRFGKRLYEKFFKHYSEKLWGIPCDQLDEDFAAQRIKGLSMSEAIVNALITKKNKPKTLLNQFPYPLSGTGMIYDRMAEAIKQNGGVIHLNCPVSGLGTKKDSQRIKTIDGKEYSFEHVISSMPLNQLIKSIPDTPSDILRKADKLRFRNTILVYLLVDGTQLFPDNWIYIHSPELKTGRITNFRNWSPELCKGKNQTILSLEFWCNEDDDFWHLGDEALIALATSELIATGLNKGKSILEGYCVRVPKCYPVYFKGYKEKYLVDIMNYVNTFEGLHVIGRYGAYKYNNQDHSILMGIMAAENIQNPGKHDLWEINTDYDYMESSDKTL